MNTPIKTNKIIFIKDWEAFRNKYDVLCIKTSEKYFKPGTMLLDSPHINKQIKSLRFIRGNECYVMLDHTENSVATFQEAIKNIEGASKVMITSILPEEMDEDIICQLMLNGLANYDSKIMKFNNLTGHLYCYHPKWLVKGKNENKDSINQIPTLELRISHEMRMLLEVHTFTSIVLKKYMTFNKKKFEQYPQYIVSAHKTLRRKLEADQEVSYIMRQINNSKSDIPFLMIDSKEKFEQSKMGVLNSIVKAFNSYYEGIATLQFEDIIEYRSVTYNNTVGKRDIEQTRKLLNDKHIQLIDSINNTDSKQFIKEVQDILNEIYFMESSVGNKVIKDALNIRIIHNKEYYEEGNDPHNDRFINAPIQHITLEDFAGIAKEGISSVLHELLIKDDLKKNQISMIEWKDLNIIGDISFLSAFEINDKQRYFSMTIHQDGTFEIKEQELNLFEMTEFYELVNIFEEQCLSTEKIRGVIKDADGNINIIRDTGWITIPELDELDKQLARGKVSRSKENREITMGAILDIKFFKDNEKYYYFVGSIGYGMRTKVERGANIRKIEAYKKSYMFFDKLLPLMNVEFVRNRQLTVVPFPFKYINEYVSEIVKHENQ